MNKPSIASEQNPQENINNTYKNTLANNSFDANKVKGAAMMATLFFLFSLGIAGFMFNKNNGLNKELDTEKIKTEFLTSEKLALNKQINGLKTETNALTGRNAELDIIIGKTNEEITKKESEITMLIAQNLLNKKNYEQQLEKIQKNKRDLIAKVENLQFSNDQLNYEIETLNKTVAALKNENNLLGEKLNKKAVVATNFRIELLRGKKEKLTVKAKKTDKVNVNFEINERPGNVNNAADQFYVEVISPTGKKVIGNTETIIQASDNELTASLSQSFIPTHKPNKVTISFEPKDKLVPGIYSILVFRSNTYLGNSQFKAAQ